MKTDREVKKDGGELLDVDPSNGPTYLHEFKGKRIVSAVVLDDPDPKAPYYLRITFDDGSAMSVYPRVDHRPKFKKMPFLTIDTEPGL